MSVSKAYKQGLDKIKGRLLGNHQHTGVQWMLEKELMDVSCKGGLLADDCGCGKTYMTTCLLRANVQSPTLIVTVVSTLHQWRDILSTFGGITPLIIGGDCPLRQVPDGTAVVLCAYSIFTPKKKKGVVPMILLNTQWGRIILDEGHAIKNQNGTTFKNINMLTAHIKWVLSATPVQNSMKDIQTLASWIGYGDKNIEQFMEEKMLRRTLTGEGERNPRFKLPKLMSEVVRLQFLLPCEQQIYDKVKDEFKTRIEHTTEGCKLYTEALQGILRCRQACCHYALLSKKRKENIEESTKFTYICNDIRDNLNEKSIIFCMWTKEIELMLASLDRFGICALKYDGTMTKERRETTLYNFKTSGINALVIQIQAGGIGLNLQCATRVYITSPTWNPTHELQAICRSHRLGQEHIVKCFRLIVEGTIEERMIDIQNKKMNIISEALNDPQICHTLNTLDPADIRSMFL